MKRYVSSREAAEYLGISLDQLYQHTSKREIPHGKRGRSLAFDLQDLDLWMRRHRVEAET